jgi:hypothetical protein
MRINIKSLESKKKIITFYYLFADNTSILVTGTIMLSLCRK